MPNSTNALTVEIMDSAYAWQDVTATCKHVSITGVGLVGQRYAYPQTGRCTLTMDNRAKTYSPSSAIGIDTGVVDSRRRVRVRGTGPSLGNKMAATLSGSTATTETDTTGSNTAGVLVQGPSAFQSQRVVSSVAGIVKAVAVTLTSTGGSGTATCKICKDNAGNPGVVLASTTFDVTTNPSTIQLPTSALVDAVNPFHIVFEATGTLQYQIRYNTAGYTYNSKTSTDGGGSWSTITPNPLRCGLIVYTSYSYFDQTVTDSSSTGNTYVLTWDGRAQFDSQVNTDYVQYITSAETTATQTNTYTNKWVSKSFSFSTTANATTIKPRFFQNLAASLLGTTTGIEYRSFTLKKNGGSNLLTNGSFTSGVASPWAAISSGGVTLTLSVASDYWVLFQGFVENIQPDMGAFSGLQSTITCVDWVEILKLQNISTILKENVTASQLVTYALTFLTSATFNATPPGTLLDTGLTTFDRVFDTNTQNVTSILEVMTNAALGDFGRVFVDRDGTIRFINRNWLPNSQNTSVKHAFIAGQGWGASNGQPLKSIDTIINSAVFTWHPRLVGGSVQVLATATTTGAVTIPGKKTDGSAGTTTMALTYQDGFSGKTIGGKNQVAMVASTDYLINDDPAGNGFNYTSNSHFSLTQVDAASQTTVTMSNTATGPLYATLLQVRGNPIIKNDPVQIKVTDATSISTYQERTFTKDMLYGTDQAFVTSLAQWMVAHYKYPFLQYGGVKIEQNTATISVSTDLLSCELFDIVTVTDAQNNVTAMRHTIIGVNYELDPLSPDYIQSVEFMLERIDQVVFFILDDATYGELDSATNLLYI